EWVVPALGAPPDNSWDKVASRSMLAASTVLVFGTSWLGSAVLNSPASAISFGLGVPLVAGPFLVQAAFALFAPAAPNDRTDAAVLLCLALGSLCFVSGSMVFLRRVEP